MKIDIQLNTEDFIGQDDYGIDVSFEEYIVERLIEDLFNKISKSKHWQDTYIINRLLDIILKESNGEIKGKFEKSIEDKINRSNVTAKINKKLSNVTEKEIKKVVIDNIDIDKIIKNEVRNIMEEKFK